MLNPTQRCERVNKAGARLGVKTRAFHLGDYRRAHMGPGKDIPHDYFHVDGETCVEFGQHDASLWVFQLAKHMPFVRQPPPSPLSSARPSCKSADSTSITSSIARRAKLQSMTLSILLRRDADNWRKSLQSMISR